MATINTLSVWSTLIIAMNRWEFMHVWMIIVHICMNSHLFIAMINVDQADDMLIVAICEEAILCWYFPPFPPTLLTLCPGNWCSSPWRGWSQWATRCWFRGRFSVFIKSPYTNHLPPFPLLLPFHHLALVLPQLHLSPWFVLNPFFFLFFFLFFFFLSSLVSSWFVVFGFVFIKFLFCFSKKYKHSNFI